MARQTVPSPLSHYCHSSHLTPFMIFLLLDVTSLLLLHLVKLEEESRAVNQAVQKHSELTQSRHYSPFTSQAKQ